MEKFKPTQEMIDAAGKVFFCMTHIMTIEPIIKSLEEKLLAEMQLKEVRNPDKVISDSKNLYLISDEDAELYCEAYSSVLSKNGYQEFAKDGRCPLLVAKHALTLAENHLIEVMEPITKTNIELLISSGAFLENWAKLIDLTLKLLAPFVDSKAILEKYEVQNGHQ
ncbi:MAG: hypothetical protein KU29_04525 [Sulfurovum sp. FS06-10]|nr:MAG: hypothetical protein KU29_04525 [Sulfurovum sp. FS06-10]